MTEVVIPETVTSIGNYAFSDCSYLKSVTIPNSVQTIGSSAFIGCTGLAEVKLEDGTAPIKFGSGSFEKTTQFSTLYLGRTIVSVSPFSSMSALTTLTVGNTVTALPDAAFKDCNKLNALTLGGSLTDIGASAFSGCSALKEVVVSPSVKTIGASAFAGNSALETIIMGHNVKTIGEKAFDGCPAKTVSITAQTPPTAPNNTFSNYSGKLYLQGQEAIDAYYDALTCWDRFDSYALIEPTGLNFEGQRNITGKPGDTIQLTASLMPENVTLPQLFWRSTNPDIATVDANGLVTLHGNITEVQSRAGDEESSCKIIAESLYADGPVLEVSVTSDTSGVDEVVTDRIDNADNTIDYSAPYEIYNMQGMFMGTDRNELTKGFYIVRQGKTVTKVIIR